MILSPAKEKLFACIGLLGILSLLLLFFLCSLASAQTFKVTAYCPCKECCEEYSDGMTASKMPVCVEILAGSCGYVACNFLDFGTELIIKNRIYIVIDRGAKKYFGTKRKPIYAIDILYLNHKDALSFGVQYLDVKIKRG